MLSVEPVYLSATCPLAGYMSVALYNATGHISGAVKSTRVRPRHEGCLRRETDNLGDPTNRGKQVLADKNARSPIDILTDSLQPPPPTL